MDDREIYIVELHVPSGRKFRRWRFRDFSETSSGTYQAEYGKRKAAKRLRKAEKYGYRARMYRKRYGRSGTYRYRFMKAYPPEHGKYRCVYCGKKIRPDKMTVDHVIPVDAAKSSKKAQRLIDRRYENGVNDLDNLVPCCYKCNQKKGSTYSWRWRIRARYGQKAGYWRFVHFVRLLLFLALLLAAVFLVDRFQVPLRQLFLSGAVCPAVF